MSPKRMYSFMIEPELLDAMKAAKARDPELTEGAILRQALRDWLKAHEPKEAKKAKKK